MLRSLVAIALALSIAPLAQAHANFIRSDPEANGQFPHLPPTLVLYFTEPLEPSFSWATVTDSTGKEVSLGSRVGSNPRTLVVDLPPNLPEGPYTVSWRAVSTLDGHLTRGIFGLAVGNASVSLLVEPATSGVTLGPEIAGRFLSLLGLLLALGIPSFLLFVGSRRIEGSERLLWVVTLLGLASLAVGSVLEFVGGAGRASGASLPTFEALRLWGSTREGRLVVGRLLLALLGLGYAFVGRNAPRWALFGGVGVFSALALGTVSLGGHASTVDPWVAGVTLDALHLAAACVWLGGVVALTLLLSRRGEGGSLEVVRRFSNVAIVAVPLLVVAGIGSALLHSSSLSDYRTTLWGRIVLLKVFLLLPLLALGAYNRFVLEPRIRRKKGEPWVRFLAGSTRAELALGAVVVLLASALGTVSPPTPSPPSIVVAADREGYHGTLVVSPGFAGVNTIRATVTVASNGTPILGVSSARFEFLYADRDIGSTEVVAKNGTRPGEFVATGSFLSAPGSWVVGLKVRLENRPDVEIFWTLRIPK